MRTCTKCNIQYPKPEESFYRAGKNLRGDCIPCQKARSRRYYLENKKAAIRRSREQRERDPEGTSAYMAEYRHKNEKRIKAQKRAHYANRADYLRARRLANPEKYIIQSAKTRAKKKDIPFDIQPKDIEVPDLCPVLGIKLEPGEGNLHDASPSLDRFIPELGYIRGNVFVISQRANRIKNNATEEEVEKVLKWMKKIKKQKK